MEELTNWANISFNLGKSRSIPCAEERKWHQQVFTYQHPDAIHNWETSREPMKGVRLQPESHSNHPCNQARSGSLASHTRWARPTWQVQVLYLPAWHPPGFSSPSSSMSFHISTIEGLERRVSRSLGKWLRLPRNLSSISLYGQNNKLKLSISNLNMEFKVRRTREVLQYRLWGQDRNWMLLSHGYSTRH